MLQHYLYASWSLFFAYWSGRPATSFSVLALLHLIVTGIAHGSTSFGEDFHEYAIYRPLTLLFGSAAGGLVAWIIEKPKHPSFSRVSSLSPSGAPLSLVYQASCLLVAAAWVGTGIAWQLAPQVWWNYLFVVSVPQMIIIASSYWFLDHDREWFADRDRAWALDLGDAASYNSIVAHWHFFVLHIVFLDVPFVVGQSIRSQAQVWPFFYSVAFFSASIGYSVIMHAIMRDQQPPPELTTVLVPAPVELGPVDASGVPFVATDFPPPPPSAPPLNPGSCAYKLAAPPLQESSVPDHHPAPSAFYDRSLED